LAAEARQKSASDWAADLAPTIRELQEGGAASLRDLADKLNDRGIPTARGDGQWTATQVQRVLARLEA
jgi:hypothetical protein